MALVIYLLFLFVFRVFAAPGGDVGVGPSLEKRNVVDEWNYNNPENRIAANYVCPHARVLPTVFDSITIWTAFERGYSYMQYDDIRPRWSGLEFPHPFNLPAPDYEYRTQLVDLGRAEAPFFLFPLKRTANGAWPGTTGTTSVYAPPGDHRVVFDQKGKFAGVSVLYTDDPDGVRLVWCYPMLDDGSRMVGATAEGYPGVDEGWEDQYDGHYLYEADPYGRSRTPPV
ncbi:hypothetical protein GGR54DRAFT_142955 [Hypoxylon sp. NC1633]|nr:hypothetical protein GGR54DRAFT_142955 [Hypoxylon sp. NC1633]